MPSPGKVNMYLAPGGLGVRVDSATYPEYQIPPFYDSIIAKLITHGATRQEAIDRMKRALDEFVIEGINTTIPFPDAMMSHDVFVKGNLNTNFLKLYDVLNEEKNV